MTLIDTQMPKFPGTTLGEHIRKLVDAMLAIRPKHKGTTAVEDLNDHMLRDIGLSRSDLGVNVHRELQNMRHLAQF